MSRFGGNPHAPGLLVGSLIGSMIGCLAPRQGTVTTVVAPSARDDLAMRKAAEIIGGLSYENRELRAQVAELEAHVSRLQDALLSARRGR